MKTQKEKDILLQEFNKLDNLFDKVLFWQTRLKIEYYNSFQEIQNNEWLIPFVVKPNSPKEIKEMNLYFIDKIEENNPNALLNLENLIIDFNNRLNLIVNKIEFINQELSIVKNKAENIQPNPSLKGFFGNMQQKSSYYCQAYLDYLYNVKEIDLEAREYHPVNLIKELNGQTWAQYQLYLIDLLNPNKEPKFQDYTHIEQMLILDYLGIGKELNNVKRAKLYSPIISRDEETTRQNFSKLDTSKSKANLESIKVLFEKVGLNTLSKQVENDINRYHKKK